MWWHYAIWVPAVIAFYVGYSWMSWRNNLHGGWMLWMTLYGMIPMWVIVSRISKKILFDGMLYDNLMFLTYVATMMALGAHDKMGWHQIAGLGLVVVGSVMMRV